MTPLSGYVLLTGSTGLLGRYLLRDMLLEGRQVCVAVRAANDREATTRVDSIIKEWESELNCILPRPVCFAGELSGGKLRDTMDVLPGSRKSSPNGAARDGGPIQSKRSITKDRPIQAGEIIQAGGQKASRTRRTFSAI